MSGGGGWELAASSGEVNCGVVIPKVVFNLLCMLRLYLRKEL